MGCCHRIPGILLITFPLMNLRCATVDLNNELAHAQSLHRGGSLPQARAAYQRALTVSHSLNNDAVKAASLPGLAQLPGTVEL